MSRSSVRIRRVAPWNIYRLLIFISGEPQTYGAEIAFVERELNTRPRKRLGWKTLKFGVLHFRVECATLVFDKYLNMFRHIFPLLTTERAGIE